MEGTMAVVTNWAANFPPRNWAYCNGQILAINTNTALFSLLGTTYGGNGQTTFGLPNLQGRTAVGTGQLSGGSTYVLGQSAGAATVSLTIANLPPHTHTGNANVSLQSNNTVGTGDDPTGAFPGLMAAGYNSTSDGSMLAPTYSTVIAPAGNGSPIVNLTPYVGINYIICLYGIYPSRN